MLRIVPARPEDAGMARARLSPLDLNKYSLVEGGLIELEGAVQLCTRKEFYDQLIRIAKTPKKVTLTDALLETLSIVAYKQPV